MLIRGIRSGCYPIDVWKVLRSKMHHDVINNVMLTARQTHNGQSTVLHMCLTTLLFNLVAIFIEFLLRYLTNLKSQNKCNLDLVRLSVLERKISTRQTREELIRKGVLIAEQGLSHRTLLL